MKIVKTLSIVALLSGCAASENVVQVKLSNGRVVDVVRTRSTVEVADCGTQLVQYLFDAEGKLIDSKSERGQALHCDLGVAIIDAGATVGAANQIRRGLKAGADTINNSNSQNQDQEMSSSTTNNLSNKKIKVNHIINGNNGFGNGGDDGSPNGKTDDQR